MIRRHSILAVMILVLFSAACGSMNRVLPSEMDAKAMEADVRGKIAEVVPEKTFAIEVGDEVPGPGADGSVPGGVSGRGATSGGGLDAPESEADDEDEMGLAVISGLVDDVEVRSGADGGVIRMSWPKTPVAVLP